MKRPVIILFLIFGLFSCDFIELEDPDVGVSTSDVISIFAEDTEILADGHSRTLVRATLGHASQPNKTITFRTDQGTFAGTSGKNSTEILSSGKEAEVYLISSRNTNSTVTISAEVGGFTVSKTISFTRSYPTDMQMSASKRKLKADKNDNTSIEIELFKNVEGNPSFNTRVSLVQNSLDSGQAMLDLPEFVIVDDLKYTLTASSLDTNVGNVEVIASIDSTNVSSSVVFELIK